MIFTTISFTFTLLMAGVRAQKLDIDNGEGNLLKDLPCVMRFNQLYCSDPGSAYPTERIGVFADDNKALLRRMFGELQVPKPVTQTTVTLVTTVVNHGFVAAPLVTTHPLKRFRRDVLEGTQEELMLETVESESRDNNTLSERVKRQADFPGNPEDDDSKTDVCESKTEVTTPFWASNSNGKVRAILNNKEFEQAVHQEICTGALTFRCSRDCSCEQKYKWHRMLAYDPNNDCAGIFMDWFLFPSCCVCRCNKNPFLG